MTQPTITARTIAAARRNTRRFATADQGGIFEIVASTPAGIIVQGTRTGALGRLVRTGQVVASDGQVRVRIEFARDIGDTAGTLAFDATHTGGRAPADVFTPRQACPCECNSGGWCGGCGHAGCGRRASR